MKSKAVPGWVKVALTFGALALLALGCAHDTGGTDTSQAPDTTNANGQVAVSLPNTGGPKTGGSLTYGIEAETDGFDPTSNRWAISGLMVANAVFDPIAAFDKDGNPQPYLAQSIDHSPDYKTWTITGRPGIKFQNGQPLDADASLKFANAIKSSPLTGPAARPIESIEKTDDNTVVFHMSIPWVAFPVSLTGQGGLIPAPEQLDDSASSDPAKKQEGSMHPIGTGPFTFDSYQRDVAFKLDRNPNYWQKDPQGRQLPYLDSVTFKPIPDASQRLSSLKAGDVNVIHDSSQAQVQEEKDLAATGKYQYFQGGGEDEESFVMINMQAEPLSDLRLRQALAYGTDLSGVEAVTGDPPDLRADSPFTQGGRWYVDPGYPQYDPVKAKQLVQQWSADHGGARPAFTLASTTDGLNAQVQQTLQSQWKDIGFDVQANAADQTTFILNAITANYQADLFRLFSAPDPDADALWWYSDNATPAGQIGLNFARIKDADLDAALDQGRENADPQVRKDAYAKVAKILAQQLPFIWLHHTRWSIVADDKVRDLLNGPLPDGRPSLPVQAGVHRLTYTWMTS
jgi:ABC-type transport system substrate-binding protein